MYKRGRSAVALLLLCASEQAAWCQTASSPASGSSTQNSVLTPAAAVQPGAAPAEVAPDAACCRLAALTPVELEILTPASSKTSRQGEEVRIRVIQNVPSTDGKIVIPTGTEGAAEVVQVSRGAFGGKAGELVIGAPYLMLSGQRIGLKRLTYGPSSGKGRTGEAMFATAVIGIAGILVSGGNIDIASGTRASAVVTTDTTVAAQH